MDLKAIPEGDGRYTLWSTRVNDVLVEDATREQLRAWYRERKPDDLDALDRLIERADERAPDGVSHRYEEATEFLSDP